MDKRIYHDINVIVEMIKVTCKRLVSYFFIKVVIVMQLELELCEEFYKRTFHQLTILIEWFFLFITKNVWCT